MIMRNEDEMKLVLWWYWQKPEKCNKVHGGQLGQPIHLNIQRVVGPMEIYRGSPQNIARIAKSKSLIPSQCSLFHSTPPTGGVESTSWNSVCLFVCLSVCPSSLQHFQSRAFKSLQNHVRPNTLCNIGKMFDISDDNDNYKDKHKDKYKDEDNDNEKLLKRPIICYIFKK